MESAAWVVAEMNRHKPDVVRVDEIGLGAGTLDRLHQLGKTNVEGVNVGAAPLRPDLMLNLRVDLFWSFREALQRGKISLPEDDRLIAELSAIRYAYTDRGKIKLEPKELTKRRIGRSPDLADACVLGFMGGEIPVEQFEETFDWDEVGGFVL